MKFLETLKESFGIAIENLTMQIKEINFKKTFNNEKELIEEIINQIEMSGTDLWENELSYFKILNELKEEGSEELSDLLSETLSHSTDILSGIPHEDQKNLDFSVEGLINLTIDVYGIEKVIQEFEEIKNDLKLNKLKEMKSNGIEKEKELKEISVKFNNLNESELLETLKVLGWDTANETIESWLEFQHYEPSEIPEIKGFEFEGNCGSLTIKRNKENFDINYVGENMSKDHKKEIKINVSEKVVDKLEDQGFIKNQEDEKEVK